MLPRVVIFDIETKLGPDDPQWNNSDSLLMEEGWDALRNGEGGISVLAIWDSSTGATTTYDEHNVDLAATHLESADYVIGYSSVGFDVPCLEGVLGRRLRLPRHIDLVEEIWRCIRLRNPFERLRGYKLKEISLRCLGRGKLEEGADAPRLYREGKLDRLYRYCIDDVHLTRDLALYMLENLGVVDAGGQFLLVPLPAALKEVMCPS